MRAHFRFFVLCGLGMLTARATATSAPAPGAAGAATFDVAKYGAKCDAVTGPSGYVSGSDDTAAINKAFAAARAAGGGTVRFPAGKCAISGPLQANFSHLTVAGAGGLQSMIVAMPTFAFDDATTPIGNDGRTVGLLWLDEPVTHVDPPNRNPAQAPLENVTIERIGFDPRSATQQPRRIVQPITGQMRAIRHFIVRDAYFELGAPKTILNADPKPDETKLFMGVQLHSLAYDTANNSHDLTFENDTYHNGNGSVQLRMEAGCAGGATQTGAKLSAIRILHETDDVDLPVDDDRDVLSASACYGGSPEISDVVIDGQVVNVSPQVTMGGVNGLRLGSCGLIDDVTYSNVTFRGSPAGRYVTQYTRWGSGTLLGAIDQGKSCDQGHPGPTPTIGRFRNIRVTGVDADRSEGIAFNGVGANGSDPANIEISHVVFTNSYGANCIRFIANTPGTGADHVHISDFQCTAAPEARDHFGSTLSGLFFAPAYGANTGLSGDVVISSGKISGYAQPLHIDTHGGFEGTAVRGVSWDTGTPQIPRSTSVSP